MCALELFFDLQQSSHPPSAHPGFGFGLCTGTNEELWCTVGKLGSAAEHIVM